MSLVQELPSVLEPLRGLESRIGEVGRAELAAILAPVIEGLREPLASGAVRETGVTALAFCRRLYLSARSAEALPLARAVLAQAAVAQDRGLERDATTACGVLAGDTADVVGAIEHHIRALRLAEDDPAYAGLSWNNIGLAMLIAGNAEMASRCYQRAVELLKGNSDPMYVRYLAWLNLAQTNFQLGSHADGLTYADRALMEQTEAIRDRDPFAALLLRRNVVRLLVAMGRIDDCPVHVNEAVALADRIRTPRALIAAATARAAYELAQGRSDVGLTRLEHALSQAREVPAALRDTLSCVIAAEEQAGNSERALLRLTELSDHVYRAAIDRARAHVELASVAGSARSALDSRQEQTRTRLISKIGPAGQPEGWDALARLGVSAVMRTDPTGWHGKRVGALSKALAMASGVDPLKALEIGFAAELHDIGMLSVPEELMAKRASLSEAEQVIVRRHIDAGAEILGDDRHPRVFLAREIVRYHHAHWDGSGYPERVGGKFIPFAARVCAIADEYDGMVSGVDSRPPRTMEQALAELAREAGRKFDPELVACFDRLVRAESEDLGVDLASASGMEGFQELVNALQEDRGFV